MNESLIEQWNSLVGPKDTIYHLGDFAFCGKERMLEIISRLNGKKVFIRGNHDKTLKSIYNQGLLDGELHDYLEFHEYIDDKKVKVVMSHYPMLTWNGAAHGAVMFHGHSHGTLNHMNTNCRRMDVGYDSLGGICRLDHVIRWALRAPVSAPDVKGEVFEKHVSR